MKKLSFFVLVAALFLSILPTGTASATFVRTPLDESIHKILDSLSLVEQKANNTSSNTLIAGKALATLNVMNHYPNGYEITDKEEFRLFLADVSTPDLGAKVYVNGKFYDAIDINNNFETRTLTNKGGKWKYKINYASNNTWFGKEKVEIVAVQVQEYKQVIPNPLLPFKVGDVTNGYVFEGSKGMQNLKTYASQNNNKQLKLVCLTTQNGYTEKIVKSAMEISTFLAPNSLCRSQKFKVSIIEDKKKKENTEIVIMDQNIPVNKPIIGQWLVKVTPQRTDTLIIKEFKSQISSPSIITGTYKGVNGTYNVNGHFIKPTKKGGANVKLKLSYASSEHFKLDLKGELKSKKITLSDAQINAYVKKLFPDGKTTKNTNLYKEVTFTYKNINWDSTKKIMENPKYKDKANLSLNGTGTSWSMNLTKLKKLDVNAFGRYSSGTKLQLFKGADTITPIKK